MENKVNKIALYVLIMVLILVAQPILIIANDVSGKYKIKDISQIKKITLTMWSCILPQDLLGCGGARGPCPLTVRGVVIFEDEKGKQCAIDYDGVAELSCKFFTKQFKIKPEDFKETTWPDCVTRNYAYTIQFKTTFKESPSIHMRPFEVTTFKIGDLKASAEIGASKCKSKKSGGSGLIWGDKIIEFD